MPVLAERGTLVAELDELGKLLKAFKEQGNRTKFKSGQAVPGVDLGQIPQPVKDKLQPCSDDQLALLADVNETNLATGLAFPGHPGIAAV